MSLPKMTTAVDNISKLDTRPNAVNGLTADALKAEFDKGPEAIKAFLNDVLIPALDNAVTLDALGAVPTTRTVNGKPLDADITLYAPDIHYTGIIDGVAYPDVQKAIDALKKRPQTLLVEGTIHSSGETTTVTGNKTYAQISDALANGSTVVGVWNTSLSEKLIVPLTHSGFAGYDFRTCEVLNKNIAVYEQIRVGADDAWSYNRIALEPSNVCFATDVSFSHVAGTETVLPGSVSVYPNPPKLGELVIGADGYTGKVTAFDDDDYPIVTATGACIFELSADTITYEKTIDGTQVENVSEALDLLVDRDSAGTFVVNVSGDEESCTADKTVAEILAAYAAGQRVVAHLKDVELPLESAASEKGVVIFRAWVGAHQWVITGVSASGGDTWVMDDQYLNATDVEASLTIGSTAVGTVQEALAALAGMIQSVEELPENPDPNVLYLIRDEDGG